MSTDRFLRLPEEKRNRFLNAAWEEFTKTRFADVSINQIIRKAGIPRGSFYQYFTDKQDLFTYLLDEVRARVRNIYRQALEQTAGDLLEAQLACFDLVTSCDLASDPLLARCVQFLRNNQGIDILKLVPSSGPPGRVLLDGVWDMLDLSRFRCKERIYVENVFCLAMAALGSSFMDSLICPERRADFRKDLVTRLNIIKHGCLADTQ